MPENSGDRRPAPNRRSVLKGLSLTTAMAGAAPSLATAGRYESPGALAMRRPGKTTGSALAPTLPSGAVIAMNRMAFGPRPGDIELFNSLGGNDQDRQAAFVAWQLDPESIDDSAMEARIAAANFDSVGLSEDPDTYLAILWDWYINDNAPGDNSTAIPRDELIRATFIRSIYSKRQLVQVLADFWHNHFNVYVDVSSWVRATMPHLDMVIRNNSLANFRTLLEVVSKSTAMLRYLDNYTSSNAGPNENFSRELFELHTLGAENYLGVMQQNEVPLDDDGLPIGYVDADVFESTRCFTGWSFSNNTSGDGDTGLFYYRPDWHDRFQKNVLGTFLPADQPDLKDGQDVLDALASHPGTGRHIARKLCQRFISDEPPQSVVDTAAAIFTDQWQAPDQIKQVVESILLSDEFLTTWGEKIKRPYEIAASALRAGNTSFIPGVDSGDSNSFFYRYDGAGQRLFSWPAPNGYPDVRGAWKSMTPRVMSWRLCGWLIEFTDDLDHYYLNLVGQTPGHVRSANALADFWIYRILGRDMEPEDRAEIVQFMAQGINPDFDLNLNDEDTRDRLRSMVGLIFMSPEFLWR
jgi:uncharacterized protein (DUF1800 family)